MGEQRRPLQAVIFDLDGLVVDSEPAHVEAWRQSMEEAVGSFDPAWILPYYGRPVATTARGLARDHGLDPDALLAAREARFGRLIEEGLPPRPGLEEAVGLLRQAGVRTALVSSGTSAYVQQALSWLRERFGIEFEFEVVVTRDDIKNPKPHPEPFLRAAELLRLDPSGCAVLEDAATGIAGAKAAGMIAVAVPNEHTSGLDFWEADSVQPDLEKAVRWLLEDQAKN